MTILIYNYLRMSIITILIITGVVTVFGQSDEIKPDPTGCFQNDWKDGQNEPFNLGTYVNSIKEIYRMR
jgi:hypothetical protein